MKIVIRAPQSRKYKGTSVSYISEQRRNELIEGTAPRLLFSANREGLTIAEANRIITDDDEPLQRNDAFHFIISLRPEDFDKMGKIEEEKQAVFREAVRAGMNEMRASLNAEELHWAAGIHRNTDNPHAHIVVWNEYRDAKQYKDKILTIMPYRLLPKHQLDENEQIHLVNSPFIQAIEDVINQAQEFHHILTSSDKPALS